MQSELVAALEFDCDRIVTGGSASLTRVLGRDAAEVTGRPLGEALGLDESALDALIEAAPGTDGEPPSVAFGWRRGADHERSSIRIEARRSADGGRALLFDLSALLEGAPPIQLAALASPLSHELRNPLSSVKMAVQTLARNAGLSERDQRRLAIANREIRTVERQLWLLSEYGRTSEAQLEAHTPRALLHEALSLVAPELEERGVQVRVEEVAPGARLLADTGRMRVVLGQLVLGVAMGQTAGQTLVVSAAPAGAGFLALHLCDPSGRLSAEEAEHLFEPYASPLARGAGLSLAVLSAVMRAQGGRVEIESSGDDGLRFHLIFRAAP